VLTRALLAFTFLSAFGLSLHAQTPCTVTIDQSPVVRGLKIGMSLGEVEAALGKKSSSSGTYDQDGYGVGSWDIPSRLLGPEQGRNLELVMLSFFDDTLTEATFSYTSEYKWDSIEQLIASFQATLKLPSAWINGPGRHPDDASIQCYGFSASASLPQAGLSLGPSLKIEDSTAAERILKRHREIDEKKRKEFKP
jgi:hypothetical protein